MHRWKDKQHLKHLETELQTRGKLWFISVPSLLQYITSLQHLICLMIALLFWQWAQAYCEKPLCWQCCLWLWFSHVFFFFKSPVHLVLDQKQYTFPIFTTFLKLVWMWTCGSNNKKKKRINARNKIKNVLNTASRIKKYNMNKWNTR